MTGHTIVDTDILIDSGRQINVAIDYLDLLEQTSTLAISSITQMELMVGCRSKIELQKTERLFKRLRLLPVNETISGKAVELLRQYRLSHGLLIPDALIASTAIVWGFPLVSKNQRDYRFITGLNLQPYP